MKELKICNGQIKGPFGITLIAENTETREKYELILSMRFKYGEGLNIYTDNTESEIFPIANVGYLTGDKVKYFKGELYVIFGIAHIDSKLYMIYKNPDKETIWARPLEDFLGKKEVDGELKDRFVPQSRASEHSELINRILDRDYLTIDKELTQRIDTTLFNGVYNEPIFGYIDTEYPDAYMVNKEKVEGKMGRAISGYTTIGILLDRDYNPHVIFHKNNTCINTIKHPYMIEDQENHIRLSDGPKDLIISNGDAEIRFRPNGDIYVNGNLADTDKEIVNAMRQMLNLGGK